MQPGRPSNPRRPSRDHIFPREWGGTFAPENIRRVCQECNYLRALAGHCVAVLACAQAVADSLPIGSRPRVLFVLRRWQASRYVKPPKLREISFRYPKSYNEWKALKREEIAALKRKHQKPAN